MLLLLIIYFSLMAIYSYFSYGLTAPNLLLSNNSSFVKWQFTMWQRFFNDRQLTAGVYFFLVIAIFIVYLLMIKKTWQEQFDFTQQKNLKKTIIIFLLTISPLIISVNALSYDVFNYIFNARMVLTYQANPHIKTALDFADDPWTKFMHNIHTPAPYGYGWTALSIIPYLLGQNKFLPTFMVFRLLSVLSLILLFLTLLKFQKKFDWRLLALFFNPLLIIEIIANSHNDLWMMVPALLSLVIVAQSGNFVGGAPLSKNVVNCWQCKKLHWSQILLSLLLLAFSISTKLASAVLIPVYLLLLTKNFALIKKLPSKILTIWQLAIEHWPLMSSVLLFLPLFTSRSQQFLPWYLSWSLVFIPLLANNQLSRWWTQILIIFSASSLMRYLPWLRYNEFNTTIINQQKLITWLPAITYCLIIIISTVAKKLASCSKKIA